jgi:menaquinone-dependent protoporphyrinogen oxidase
VQVVSVDDIDSVEGYDAFIIGSPIQDGMWLHSMFRFLDRFGEALTQKPTYMWITCIRVMEADGYAHALDSYVHKPTLEKLGVRDVAVFAGKLALESINWDERWLLSVRYDGAEVPGSFNKDYRDWHAIAAWANKVAHELKLTPVFD